jgi:hypothetical protein
MGRTHLLQVSNCSKLADFLRGAHGRPLTPRMTEMQPLSRRCERVLDSAFGTSLQRLPDVMHRASWLPCGYRAISGRHLQLKCIIRTSLLSTAGTFESTTDILLNYFSFAQYFFEWCGMIPQSSCCNCLTPGPKGSIGNRLMYMK